ncbi:MAG: excisionase family DNA-binding protein [Anaeromyxobacteraceae bacterium]
MQGFYTTHEAARLLGVSLPTVVNWITARRLRAHRTPGGHRRIAREELAAFMLRQGMPLPEELNDAAPGRRKALVLGESGPMREGLALQLAVGGFAVEQASPGFAAGATAARFQPDLVILCTAAEDGGDTLAGLRADRELASVPVLAVCLAASSDALSEAGCDAVLAKPLHDGAILDTARQLLGPPSRSSKRRRVR